MNLIRVGNVVVNMTNVECFMPDPINEDKTKVFFVGGDDDFAVLDISFEGFYNKLNRMVIVNG